MAFTVLMALEGVMAEETTTNARSEPIPEGRMLFYALRGDFHIVLSTLDAEGERVEHWLKVNNIRPSDYARLLLNQWPDLPPYEVRGRHIMNTRALGYDLRYVISDDPRVAKMCIERGITPLCCPHPVYSRSSFLPDSKAGAKSWEEIEATQLGLRKTREEDKRMLVDDFVEGYEEARE